jgi:GTPase
LRHIERTKALLHCISCEEENPEEAYKIVRNELSLYNKDILNKPEVLLLTKTDLVNEDEMKDKLTNLKKINPVVFPVSILDEKSLKDLADFLTKEFKNERI